MLTNLRNRLLISLGIDASVAVPTEHPEVDETREILSTRQPRPPIPYSMNRFTSLIYFNFIRSSSPVFINGKKILFSPLRSGAKTSGRKLGLSRLEDVKSVSQWQDVKSLSGYAFLKTAKAPMHSPMYEVFEKEQE